MLITSFQKSTYGYMGRVVCRRDNSEQWHELTGIDRLTKADALRDAVLLANEILEQNT